MNSILPEHPDTAEHSKTWKRSRTTTEELVRSFTEKVDICEPAQMVGTHAFIVDDAETVSIKGARGGGDVVDLFLNSVS